MGAPLIDPSAGLSNVTSPGGLVTDTVRDRVLNQLRESGISQQGPVSNAQTNGLANPYGRSLSAFEPNTQVYNMDPALSTSDAQQLNKSDAAAMNAPDAQKLNQSDAALIGGGAAVPNDVTPVDDPMADQRNAAAAAAKAASAASGYASGGAIDATGRVQQLVAAALALAAKHTPYVWGGTTASGVDCSGLIYYAARAAGLQWNRYRSVDYGRIGTAVDMAHARPGDIVYYDEGGGNGHVGIYLGAGMMVAAPQSGEDVKIQNVYGTPTRISRVFSDNSFGTTQNPDGSMTWSYGGRQWNPLVSNGGQAGLGSLVASQAVHNIGTAVSHAFSGLFGGGAPSRYAEAYGSPGMNDVQWQAYLDGNGAFTRSNPQTDGQVFTGPTVQTEQIHGNVPYLDLFQQAAAKYGVPVSLLAAVARQESGFNPNARSRVGALGIMQFMPGTARGLGVNPLDPVSAIDGGARYLSGLYAQFGRWDYALAAYNAGAGAVRQYGGIPPYAETQNYVRSITALQAQYAGV